MGERALPGALSEDTGLGRRLCSDWVPALKRSAVQAIGDRQVVFVPAGNEDGKFIQRQVLLGSPIGDNYSVLSGLKLGETVVTGGSFFLRAEVLRNAPGG